MSTLLIVATGTGNSLHVARHLAQTLGDTEIVLLPDKVPALLPERVGFITPIRYGVPDGQMVEFLENGLPRSDVSQVRYTFSLLVYGHAVASGDEVMETLIERGGLAPSLIGKIKSVDTQVTLKPLPHKELMEKILDDAETETDKLADLINNEEIHMPKVSLFMHWRMKVHLPGALKTANSTKSHLLVADTCIGCDTCTKLCPTRNIVLEKGRPVFNQSSCTGCFGCVLSCPKQSIYYEKNYLHQSYTNPRSRLEATRNAQA